MDLQANPVYNAAATIGLADFFGGQDTHLSRQKEAIIVPLASSLPQEYFLHLLRAPYHRV